MRDRSPAEWLCCRDVRDVWIRISLHETEAAALFKGGHFEAEIILLCVRWNLGYPLSLRQLEEIMAELNLSVDHVTIWRCVQRYAPLLNRRSRYHRSCSAVPWPALSKPV